MSKNILVPSTFFLDVYRLINILDSYELNSQAKALCASLETQIQAKLTAMDRRKIFTKYKTASPGSDERELYRRDYLNKSGIHEDWRSDKEISL